MGGKEEVCSQMPIRATQKQTTRLATLPFAHRKCDQRGIKMVSSSERPTHHTNNAKTFIQMMKCNKHFEVFFWLVHIGLLIFSVGHWLKARKCKKALSALSWKGEVGKIHHLVAKQFDHLPAFIPSQWWKPIFSRWFPQCSRFMPNFLRHLHADGHGCVSSRIP